MELTISNHLMDLTSFEQVSEISRGATSTTYKYKEKSSNEIYCVKVFIKELQLLKEQKKFANEVSLLFKVKNPAVISIYGYNDNCPGIKKPIIITKYYPTSLERKIKESYDVPYENKIADIPLPKKYIIILGIAEGMKYLHSAQINIVHRDLKPGNILLNEEDHPIICDLGVSRLITNDMSSGVGTTMYMAPEIAEGNYTSKVDVFSFAILLYEIYTWRPPYPDYDDNSLSFLGRIQNGMRPDTTSINNDVITNFLNDLWARDPSDRPTFDEIVERIKSREFRQAMGVTAEAEDEVNRYLSLFGDSLEPGSSDAGEIRSQADAGDVDKMIEYAEMMHNEGKDDEALAYYKKAAGKDNVQAMRIYASLLVSTRNDENSKREAIEYMKKATKAGDYSALQEILRGGFGEVEVNELIDLFKSCADHGSIEACFIYANMLYDGDAIRRDVSSAFDYFKKAANGGNTAAILRAARMLQEGEVDSSKGRAEVFFEEGVKLNDPDTMFFYALSIINGGYLDVNKAKMIDLLKQSSNLGNVNAMLFYATIIENMYFDVGRDRKAMNDLFGRADREGNEESAKLSFYLASEILKGKMNSFKAKDATLFLKQAAKKGNLDGIYYYSIYLYLNHDEGDQASIIEALSLFKDAIEKGHPEASLDLAFMVNKFGDKVYLKNNDPCYLEGLKEGAIRAIIRSAKVLPKEEATKHLKKAISMGSEKAVEAYCEISGIFYKFFYAMEEIRKKYGVDAPRHATSIIVDSLHGDNKAKTVGILKEQNVNSVDGVINQIQNAYLFIFKQSLNNDLIRETLRQSLSDSDF